MLVEQYGKIIRDKRIQAGLKQEQLAERANVSRAVVSGVECGKRKAVQADIVERLFAVLGVQPQVLQQPDRDSPRKLARLHQEVKLREQRERHLRLAFGLAEDEQAAAEGIAKARERVELWRRKKSCSPFYIDRWSQLLALPPRQLAREMFRLGDWEAALFQNSPWSWAWT